MLSSAFIYLNYWGLSYPVLNTFLGLLALYLLLSANTATWFVSGALIGLFWFWWIALSLIHYHMVWAAPIEILIIMFTYGVLFALISAIASIPVGCCALTTPKLGFMQKIYCFICSKWCCQGTTPYLISLTLKAVGLMTLSYIHPFSFDWFKPELMFVESYLGIEKFKFAMILGAIVLSLWRKQILFLFLVVLAYTPTPSSVPQIDKNITLLTTHTSVEDKWNEALHAQQFQALFSAIDQAIANHKKLIILPESVFPIFLNRSETLLEKLQKRAKHISIVTGGLYWDGKTPRNSTYIFTDGKIQVANKVLLVPFGEANPLPDFLSDWVNEVFYDGAIDYKASSKISDYQIDGKTYRNAICFEATSEKLYEGYPKNMIVLSNNGWFHPSMEPTLQQLLLQYYSKKYGTTIYHSINMSSSYMIKNAKVTKE